jgi:hypothetical protein
MSLTHWTIYPWGKNPQYPLDRRVGGPQNQCGSSDENNSLPLSEIEAHSLVTKLTLLLSNVYMIKTLFLTIIYINIFLQPSSS